MEKSKININKKGFNIGSSNSEINKLINIFIAISALFVVFYLITLFVTNKSNEEVIIPTEIQYEEIIVGTILNQDKDVYYVLATKEDDINQSLIDYYLNKYVTSVNGQKLGLATYGINLDNAFNKPFVKESSNLNVTKIEDIAFKDATLLKIEKGKITEFYEGVDQIKTHLLGKIK
jgi:hypothetical protein